jgi:quercetin dioxygenase-like cupin family protein
MELRDRLVRYSDLKPCLNAFIDTRSPGSDKKENFTIIGPGVSENPDQHIHIAIPHGFNIGGARQPPGCLNSQHSHLTAEVFLVHSGTWAFRTGEHASDGEIILTEGDVISLPTDVFRGFENVGEDEGYLYAILGGDDPGRVMWAPGVFDMAEDYGLILMEDGSLVDTVAGQEVPADNRPMPRTSTAQVASLRKISSDELNSIVIRSDDYSWCDDTSLSDFDGVQEAALLGPANALEEIPSASLDWLHDFVLRAIRMRPGAAIPAHARAEEEVIFVLDGGLQVQVGDESLNLDRGDTFTTPIGARRSFSNTGDQDCRFYLARRGDQPAAPLYYQGQE